MEPDILQKKHQRELKLDLKNTLLKKEPALAYIMQEVINTAGYYSERRKSIEDLNVLTGSNISETYKEKV